MGLRVVKLRNENPELASIGLASIGLAGATKKFKKAMVYAYYTRGVAVFSDIGHVNIALDGVRAGGCKYLVAAMWSEERDKAMWLSPQVHTLGQGNGARRVTRIGLIPRRRSPRRSPSNRECAEALVQQLGLQSFGHGGGTMLLAALPALFRWSALACVRRRGPAAGPD